MRGRQFSPVLTTIAGPCLVPLARSYTAGIIVENLDHMGRPLDFFLLLVQADTELRSMKLNVLAYVHSVNL